MINAYKKGSRTEREVARRINQILETNLKRTPMSGAFKDIPGDIVCFDSKSIASKWFWEVKNRKEGILRIVKWYDKAKEETPKDKKTILVATTNFKPFFAFLLLDDFLQILKELEYYKRKYDNFGITFTNN